jgi:DNA-binding response OmpR family regulator
MTEKKTLLIVDDDPEIRTALRTVLERKGYRVLMAADGNTGLALAESEAPHVVIVDMMMPKKSGFLVLEKIKRRGADSPKVIMITGNEGSRHRAYAELLGVDDYIRKPFTFDRLLESVERLCPAQEPEPTAGEAPGPEAKEN